MAEHRRRVDKVLDPAFLYGLSDGPLDELRSCHADRLDANLAERHKVGQA